MNTPTPLSTYQDITATADINALKQGIRNKQAGSFDHVAENFEAIMIKIMIGEMRKTIPDSSLFDDYSMKLWESFYDDQIAHRLAHQWDLGLKRNAPHPLDQGTASPSMDPTAHPPSAQRIQNTQRTDVHHAKQPSYVTQFIQRIHPLAEKTARLLHLPTHYIMAHAALESGWGRHEILTNTHHSAHNLFGIKATAQWHGPVTLSMTKEYVNHKMVTIPQLFRVYPNDEAGFADYAAIMKKKDFGVLEHAQQANHFLHQLIQQKYSTDPIYIQKLKDVIHFIEKNSSAAPISASSVAQD